MSCSHEIKNHTHGTRSVGYASKKAKKMNDAGEPAPEDGDIEELSDSEMLLNRESNPGLPRLVGVNDKRKS